MRISDSLVKAVVLVLGVGTTVVAQPTPESVRYTYDTSGRLSAVSLPGADAVYTWDASGNRTSALVSALLAPVVESVSPSAGASNTPVLVHVRGRGFLTTGAGTPTVAFGVAGNVHGTATEVAVVSDSLIVALAPPLVGVPPQSSPLVRDVVVTFPGQAPQTLAGAFRSVTLGLGGPADDLDGDGLPDLWEAQFGTDPQVNDAGQDDDGDGVSNLAEYRAGTHPRGGNLRYLAEGATSGFFDYRLALFNPSAAPADVLVRAMRRDGAIVTSLQRLGAFGRATVLPKALPGLADAEFSMAVESSVPLVVDRTMEWDATGYGSHAETSVAAPALEWYLAEGATHSGFDLFYLIQNPNDAEATVTVRYLRPAPAPPLTKTYPVAANSRFNVWVDYEGPDLEATDVSAVITSSRPVIVERAMYQSRPGRPYGAGHESAGITLPARSWFLAEGATGPYFDLFVLVANPNDRDTQVRATYLLDSGVALQKTYAVAANSRFNIWVDYEQLPEGSGQFPLADVAVSTIVESLDPAVPVIVERAMWWPQGNWHEAHNAAGTTTAGTMWALAEGEAGGARLAETYVLVANTSPFDGAAKVTVHYEGGGSDTTVVPLAATSRTNVVPAALFTAAPGRRFATVIESVDTGAGLPRIVVERAMYTTTGGIHWTAGTDAVATRLR